MVHVGETENRYEIRPKESLKKLVVNDGKAPWLCLSLPAVDKNSESDVVVFFVEKIIPVASKVVKLLIKSHDVVGSSDHRGGREWKQEGLGRDGQRDAVQDLVDLRVEGCHIKGNRLVKVEHMEELWNSAEWGPCDGKSLNIAHVAIDGLEVKGIGDDVLVVIDDIEYPNDG